MLLTTRSQRNVLLVPKNYENDQCCQQASDKKINNAACDYTKKHNSNSISEFCLLFPCDQPS